MKNIEPEINKEYSKGAKENKVRNTPINDPQIGSHRTL